MTSAVPGAFCLVLHSHLPWLPGHGVWPLGEEWLHQAWVESYLPLVAELDALAAEGQRDVLTLGVTPVLAAQLDHPGMLADAGTWAGLWEMRAREMGAGRDAHRREMAAYEYAAAARARTLLATRWAGGGSPVLRSLRDAGVVELLGGPAAHPFLPLLLPEFAAVALEAGLADASARLGQRPGGIWSPECGYSPGLADIFAAAGVDHFLVDEQTVRAAGGHPHAAWRVAGTDVVAVPRDLEVTNLVWSSRSGYPAAGSYRDFHVREEFTGIRLWSITHPDAGIEHKGGYDPAAASAQLDHDVAHFVEAVRGRLAGIAESSGAPGLVVAAYDTELFGHWWFEGPEFLKNVALEFAKPESQVKLISCTDYLDQFPPAAYVALPEGSWGAESNNSVWLNEDTAWTWKHIYPSELAVQQIANSDLWHGNETATRLVKQICRELLLLESSDWQFLITTKAARDYAEKRFNTHLEQFRALLDTWRRFEATRQISAEKLQELEAIELRDSVFQEIDPELWATTHAVLTHGRP